MLGWQTKPLGASQFWGAALWTVLLIGTIHMGLVECSRWQFAFILRCICPDDVGGRHHTWSSHPWGQPAKGSRSRMHFGECAGGRLPPGNTPFCFPRGPNYKANFFLWWFRCRRNSFLCGWCSGGWGPQLRGLFSQCDFHADSSWRSFTSTDILHSCAIEVSQKPSLFFFFFLARNDVLIFLRIFFENSDFTRMLCQKTRCSHSVKSHQFVLESSSVFEGSAVPPMPTANLQSAWGHPIPDDVPDAQAVYLSDIVCTSLHACQLAVQGRCQVYLC